MSGRGLTTSCLSVLLLLQHCHIIIQAVYLHEYPRDTSVYLYEKFTVPGNRYKSHGVGNVEICAAGKGVLGISCGPSAKESE